MSFSRSSMIEALKEIVIPELRELGFKGSFPHYRRIRADQIDLLTFQFDRHSGGFVIEIGKCPPEGFTNHFDKFIPPNKVTAWDVNHRFRIQRKGLLRQTDWFRYDQPSWHGDIYQRTAKKVLPALEQAEEW